MSKSEDGDTVDGTEGARTGTYDTPITLGHEEDGNVVHGGTRVCMEGQKINRNPNQSSEAIAAYQQ